MKKHNFTEIKITKGESTIVSNEDFDSLNIRKWQCFARVRNGRIEKYARTTMQINGKKTSFLMHRFIMGNPKGFLIDHINGDTLDNRRENLRVVTNSQNLMNSRIRNNTSSKYKGVSFDKNSQKFKAQIQINKNKKHLGLFSNEIDAAKCYNENALKLFGEYAKTNEQLTIFK